MLPDEFVGAGVDSRAGPVPRPAAAAVGFLEEHEGEAEEEGWVEAAAAVTVLGAERQPAAEEVQLSRTARRMALEAAAQRTTVAVSSVSAKISRTEAAAVVVPWYVARRRLAGDMLLELFHP
jgi:hypothetical protein